MPGPLNFLAYASIHNLSRELEVLWNGDSYDLGLKNNPDAIEELNMIIVYLSEKERNFSIIGNPIYNLDFKNQIQIRVYRNNMIGHIEDDMVQRLRNLSATFQWYEFVDYICYATGVTNTL